MNWTTEQPVKLGWYWYRGDAESTPCVLKVFIDESDNSLSVRTGDYPDQINFIENFCGDLEWAGPIPEPSEPKGEVEEDGDEIFTPIPATCQKFACREHHPKLENKKGFMVCPRCNGSYGKAAK